MAPPIGQLLKHLEAVPIEYDKSLLKLAGRPDQLKLMMWDGLKGKDLDQVFTDKQPGVIFLVMRKGTESSVGHFICAWKHKGVICYFDPYGFPLATKLMQLTNNQDYLTPMCRRAGVALKESQFRIQEMDENVECCARHVCCRLRFWNLGHPEYYKFINSCPGLNPDATVTMMTMFFHPDHPHGYKGEDFVRHTGGYLAQKGVYFPEKNSYI